MEFKTLKVIFKHLFSFLVLAIFSLSASASIMLKEGHVRAMPASVPNTAAYLTLMNHSDNAVSLVSVTTPVAKEAQLHTLIEENGVVKMRQVEGFDIESHGTLMLQPSGNHIMLLSLTKSLMVGDKVPLTLTFSDGEQLDIELIVAKKSASDIEESHHHHHH
ncbi:copper chaperone PCu(A)C [Shewanella donghaensis]|uniref:copper chaperone PCu(A)C n=1 Tax=Shewanella donghaensis TaxID=238836 RepID=UPI001183A100|nr:copper chaperone PCu(A)C [Shewanella donghaensis]